MFYYSASQFKNNNHLMLLLFYVFMKLVEQHIIKPNNVLYKDLDNLCFLSKNLYNQALYRIRQ